MLKGLRRRLERALERLESRSGEASEREIDRLLAAMREELITARAGLKKLEEEEEDLRERLEGGRGSASGAGPGGGTPGTGPKSPAERLRETRRELSRQRAEVRDLTSRIKDARNRRNALAARDRRVRSRRELSEAGRDTGREFDRIAEGIEDVERLAGAEREAEEALDSAGRAPEREAELRETDRRARADAQLRELKRRMGIVDSREDPAGSPGEEARPESEEDAPEKSDSEEDAPGRGK